MADRDGREWGGPGEQSSAAISPVIGNIERMSTSPTGPGTGGDGSMGRGGTAIQVLRDLRYPLARDDLVREAAGHGAPGELLDLLARLPGRVYRSAEDVAGELERTPAWYPGPMR